MKTVIWAFVFILVCILPGYAESRIKVVWLSTMSGENNPAGFEIWKKVRIFMMAAAEDLDVELKIYYHNRNPVRMIQNAEIAVSGKEKKPDVVLFHNLIKSGEPIIKICQKHGVKAFVFNSGFEKNAPVGIPRGKYKNWIGEMTPDDEKAGFLLTQELMKAAMKLKKVGPDGKIHIMALAGSPASQPSIARLNGLKKALSNNKLFVIKQTMPADWNRQKAYDAFDFITSRYPSISVFWAASDTMALGIHKRASEKLWKAGTDYLTGGIDWLDESLQLVRKGELTTSVGGHFAQGAWALIVIHDYLKGYDFAESESTIMKTNMSVFTKNNIQRYKNVAELFSEETIRKIDFRKFSKVHNPDVIKYKFHLEEILGDLK